MRARIQSFEEFWPFYLSQHREPVSRRLHFLGTSGWMASVAGSTVLSPVAFPAAMAGFAGALWNGSEREKEGRPLANILIALALPSAASPVVFPSGVLFAYACAWIGHFGVEKNRPATFEYPVWSFLADLRMWSLMAQGKLWSGDPLEELGLDEPSASSSPEDLPAPEPAHAN